MSGHDSEAEKRMANRFTKPADAVRYITELESLDLSTVTDRQLEALLDKFFPVFPYTRGIIEAGEEVFRARINVNNVPYTNVKDIYVRDRDAILTYGRAHRPCEQIFYCSSNYLLAAFEVIQEMKHDNNPNGVVADLTIGIWKAQRDLQVTNIIHSKKLHDLRKDILELYKSNQDLLNNGRLQSETIDANNLLLQFFSDQFTKDNIKDNAEYRISSLYASRLKQANDLLAPQYYSERFDGINYPSVAMKFKGDNQAIFTDNFQSKFQIVNAIQVVCGNINFETGEFMSGVLHEAESIDDGVIKWSKEIYQPKTPI